MTGAYVLGHSDGELDRLAAQARLIEPITRRFFTAAGIARGMRVLDVGSGIGDIAFLAAELVGEAGEVVGVERAAAALNVARQRARSSATRNVTFLQGDPARSIPPHLLTRSWLTSLPAGACLSAAPRLAPGL